VGRVNNNDSGMKSPRIPSFNHGLQLLQPVLIAGRPRLGEGAIWSCAFQLRRHGASYGAEIPVKF